MGYKYCRKSTCGNYGIENLHEAVKRVPAGELSKRKAELVYGVPQKH